MTACADAHASLFGVYELPDAVSAAFGSPVSSSMQDVVDAVAPARGGPASRRRARRGKSGPPGSCRSTQDISYIANDSTARSRIMKRMRGAAHKFMVTLAQQGSRLSYSAQVIELPPAPGTADTRRRTVSVLIVGLDTTQVLMQHDLHRATVLCRDAATAASCPDDYAPTTWDYWLLRMEDADIAFAGWPRRQPTQDTLRNLPLSRMYDPLEAAELAGAAANASATVASWFSPTGRPLPPTSQHTPARRGAPELTHKRAPCPSARSTTGRPEPDTHAARRDAPTLKPEDLVLPSSCAARLGLCAPRAAPALLQPRHTSGQTVPTVQDVGCMSTGLDGARPRRPPLPRPCDYFASMPS